VVTYPKPVDGLPIVIIDFDGVLAENIWPNPGIGAPIKKGISMVIHYAKAGNEIIVHTSRPHSHAQRIWGWLTQVGLSTHVYDVVCGKPRGGLYVDDRAWNPSDRLDPNLIPFENVEMC
jgi:hypothetical protein